MGLKATLDSLDGLDQALHSYYVKGEDGKFTLDAEGVEDVSGLKSTAQRERDARKKLEKEVQDLNTKFKDIDPDKVRQILSRVSNDEEARLIADGKLDEVIEKRSAKLRTELERQVHEAQAQAKSSAERAQRYEQRVLDDQIRAAATKAGVHPQAIDDALFRGRTMFSLSEDGGAIQKSDDGNPVMGKDGKTPYSPNEWLSEMKESAPHWFPATPSGGGSNGARGAQGGPDLSKLPPAARLTEARRTGRA